MKALVYVTYKPGILDPQGQTVHQVLLQHGESSVRDVRIGKYIECDLEDMPRERAVEMLSRIADQLFANSVIETYRVEIP